MDFSRRFLPAILLWLLYAVQPAAAGDRAPSPVTLTAVTTATLRQEVRLTGTSIPWRMVPLSPRVEGLASKVLVDKGTWVQLGQPILELDPRLAEIEIEVAKARLEGTKARLRDAIRKREELRKLEKRQHASQTAIASSIAEVEMATAAVTQERAELERFRELRARHSVSAPFAGMVVSKQVEVGQWVKQDSSVIELVAMDTLRVQAPLPQLYYPRVAVGARARVFFDAFPDREFEGSVHARVALGNEASRSFPLLIDIPNPDHLLAPGMSARILVEMGKERLNVLMISRDAVVTRSNESQVVWRVLEDDGVLKAHPVKIETGRAQDDQLEVVDGELRAGDRVVLLGNENLRPGQAVRANTEQSAVAVE